MTDIKDILEERGTRYGEFSNHAKIAQSLKDIVKDYDGNLEPYMKEAIDMTMHKIARILNGDPYYDDSWVDIVGYNQLVVDELRKDPPQE